jgi:hypothetical protein
MKTFVTVIFWLYACESFCRIFNLATGVWANPISINVYCADTVVTAVVMIWAGFVLWW